MGFTGSTENMTKKSLKNDVSDSSEKRDLSLPEKVDPQVTQISDSFNFKTPDFKASIPTENPKEPPPPLQPPPNQPTHSPNSPASTAPPPDGGWGWMVVLGSAIFHFFYIGHSYATGVFYVGFRSAFPSASSAELATVMSNVYTVMFFLSPAAAALLRLGFSARQLIGFSGVLAAVGNVIAGVSPSVTGIRISFNLFLGLAGAFSFLPSLSLIGLYFERRRSLATGLATLGSGLGGFVLPPLLALSFDEYGLFGTMLLVGAAMLHISFSGMLHRPLPLPLRGQPSSDDSSSRKDSILVRCLSFLLRLPRHLLGLFLLLLRSPYLRPPVLLHLLAQLLGAPAIWIPVNFLPALAKDHGIPEVTASTLSSIISAGNAAGRFLVGFSMDLPWLRRRRVVVAAAVMICSSVADLCGVFAASYGAFAAFAACRGVLDGFSIVLRLLVLQDLVGRESYTDALGLMNVFLGVGMLAVPPVAGIVVDKFGVVEAAFVTTAALHFVGAAFMSCIAWQGRKLMGKEGE